MLNESNFRIQKSDLYPFWLKAPLILIGLCLLVLILSYGRFILMPLAFAALFSMLLNPVIKRLESWKLGRVISILLALTIITVLLSVVIALITVQLIQFSDSLPDIADKIKNTSYTGIHLLEGMTGISEDRLTEYIKNGLKTLFETGGEFMSSMAEATKGTLIFLSLLPIFIFFMLYYKKMYRTFIEKTFEKSHNSEIDSVIKRVQTVTQNYLVGVFIVIGIIAALNTIGLLIIGLEYAIFFAVFASFLAIIPYVGSLLGALPAVLYATLTGDSFLLPLLVILVFVTVQIFEGNFITPKIIGSKVSINPFVAVIALLIGAEIWGIAGMILFIPLIGILRVGFSQVQVLKPYGYLLGNIIDYEESDQKKD
ncbi:AI-2E family transporter [Rhodohalobacter barkolensis]|uniref:AI-2E family transporter n=1 Tax=Rhodohalobacter barkolensis TaxID=2053187 RepID=A0A2N0VJH6_9BACT|nr:AI-2E family transporter [Rhodohalobacter barkolensis]PKD44329.1 AI-2E family transporter [Rhodohalobacter barkolensis]